MIYRISEEEVLASAGLDAFVVRGIPMPRFILLTLGTVPIFLPHGYKIHSRDLLLPARRHVPSAHE